MRGAALWTLALGACGGNPCEGYVDAVLACYADAGIDAPGGVDVGTQCPDDTTKQSERYYRCRQDAWAAGDCSGVEGISAIQVEEAGCTPD